MLYSYWVVGVYIIIKIELVKVSIAVGAGSLEMPPAKFAPNLSQWRAGKTIYFSFTKVKRKICAEYFISNAFTNRHYGSLKEAPLICKALEQSSQYNFQGECSGTQARWTASHFRACPTPATHIHHYCNNNPPPFKRIHQ